MDLYVERIGFYRSRFARLCAITLNFLLFSSIFISGVGVAAAQSEVSNSPERLLCQDVFSGNRLSTEVTVATETVSPSESLSGVVSLGYTGDMPLHGMNVYVVLSSASIEGQVLNAPVAFVTAAEAVTLQRGFSNQYEFSIPTPYSLPAGSYEVSVYVLQHDPDTAYGLVTYGRDAAARTTVTVAGDAAPATHFEADSLTLDGEVVEATSYFVLSSTDPINATFTVLNETDRTARGHVTWELFEGMTAQPGNVVATTQDEFKIIIGLTKVSTFTLTHTIETLAEGQDTLTNEKLQADSYVLRATLTVDGVVTERFAIPLVQDVSKLVATEPILEYLHVYPNQDTAAACVSLVPESFAQVSPKETLTLTVVASKDGAEVARGEATLVAEEYQRLGAFKAAAARGLSTYLTFDDAPAGSYDLSATLTTGINNPDFSVPKHRARVTGEIGYQYDCSEPVCVGESAPAPTPASHERFSSGSMALILLALLGALVMVLFATRSHIGVQSPKDDTDAEDEDLTEDEGDYGNEEESSSSDDETDDSELKK